MLAHPFKFLPGSYCVVPGEETEIDRYMCVAPVSWAQTGGIVNYI